MRARSLLLLLTLALAGCAPWRKPPPAPAPPPPRKLVIGLALGGGAAKGFAHIGVIKMLEASDIHPDVVSGTSAGSVVGALYASGMDAFAMQQAAIALDQASLRDVRLFGGGLVQGRKLQDYIDAQVRQRPIERLRLPFAAVATDLASGQRTVFTRGDTGQAVRASCSVPGVFEPALIGGRRYVDGGVVSPVPVDAARQLGADFVIAVDISARSDGSLPTDMLGIVGRSVVIMGQHLGAQELARADVVVQPQVNAIGAADFEQRDRAIMEGERATLAAIPLIRARLAAAQRMPAAVATH
ncbi:MAG TPA: patatin-like phospholipase family protein [Frateuria sp.]|uniref:patatin-like phospholipase family protein n=1 Tax=Frateuria sp. TaxID=2211372 RepID=UPI002DE6E629|nr:patatin-like phospholipase family protein [Frateuria sp.]